MVRERRVVIFCEFYASARGEQIDCVKAHTCTLLRSSFIHSFIMRRSCRQNLVFISWQANIATYFRSVSFGAELKWLSTPNHVWRSNICYSMLDELFGLEASYLLLSNYMTIPHQQWTSNIYGMRAQLP